MGLTFVVVVVVCSGVVVGSNDDTTCRCWSDLAASSSLADALGLIVVFLAHADQNGLFGAIVDGTKFLFGSVSDASASLDGHLGTPCRFATLSGWAVCAAETRLFNIFGAARMLACFALGSVRNAQPSLNHAIGASFVVAFATNAFAGPTGR